MGYFRGSIEVGHWGSGEHVNNHFYVWAPNALAAMDIIRTIPSVKHNFLPEFVEPVSEQEYIINSCVDPFIRHYNRDIKLSETKFIKNTVLLNVKREHAMHPEQPYSAQFNRISGFIRLIDSAKTEKELAYYYRCLRRYILECYENQEEIIANTDGRTYARGGV